MKLDWRTREALVDDPNKPNVYGYYTHNMFLFEEVQKLVEITEDAEDSLIITSPEGFVPVEGKHNWLFTMFEGLDLPEEYLIRVALADYLFVPSTWTGGVFRKYLHKTPIHVVHHGVRPEYTYKKRTLPKKGEKFRFLWCGAMNPRKGYEECEFAWDRLGFHKLDTVELYYKTAYMENAPQKIFTLRDNIVVDNRDLPLHEYVKIYHDAHCFLFPSRGEGFGLTLAEAMATGLPCIATYYSGMMDFFDEQVGYPCDKFIASAELTHKRKYQAPLKTTTRLGMPDMGDIIGWMVHVTQNYDEAIENGRLASERIKKYFTWELSAKRLVALMEMEINKRNGKNVD